MRATSMPSLIVTALRVVLSARGELQHANVYHVSCNSAQGRLKPGGSLARRGTRCLPYWPHRLHAKRKPCNSETIRYAFSTQRILVGSSMYAGSRDSAAANKQLQVETPYASCYVRRSQRPRTVLNRALVSETSVKSGTHYCSGSFAPVQVASLHRSQT